MLNAIYVIPLGAHEYHGPHLPFETDAIIAHAFADKLHTKTSKHISTQILSTEQIGYSVEHMDIAGTQTLSYTQAIEQWIKIGDEAYQNGCKKILFLNAHGGNSPLMTIVTTQLRMRYKILAAATSWTRFGLPEHLITQAQKQLDIHGGFIETSLMLYLAPEKVKMDLAENFYNNQEKWEKEYCHLRAYGPHSFGWKMRDLNTKGAAGNASLATKEAGKAIFDHALNGLIELIDDIHRFDINDLI